MTTTETTIGINGMAHVILTVSQFAAARAFYGRLLPALGMTPVCDTDKLFYCVGARTAIGIQPAGPAHDGDRFVQSRVGLHHLCLRARSREDVDRLHDLLRQIGAIIIHGPQEGTWAPGYYSLLFEDPDGIRLEANFVPGAPASVGAFGLEFCPVEAVRAHDGRGSNELAQTFAAALACALVMLDCRGRRARLEARTLGVGVFSGVRFRSPDADQIDPSINIAGRRVKVDRRFLQLLPEEQNKTVEEIVNHLNAETAKRYAAYVLLPPLATLALGLLGAWVLSRAGI